MNELNKEYNLSQTESFLRMVSHLNTPDPEYSDKDEMRHLVDLLDKLVQMDGTWIPIEKKGLPSFNIFKGNDGKFRIQFLDNEDFFDFKAKEIEPDSEYTLLKINISGSLLELGYHRNEDQVYIGKTFYRRSNPFKTNSN